MTVPYCKSCAQRFGAETGRDLPAGPQEAGWGAYVKWALQDYRRIRQRIAETVHRHRPEMMVSFNWAYTMPLPEPAPPYADCLVADISPEDQIFNGSYQARHWAASGKSFDVMNSAFMQWWGDWACKPATAMQHGGRAKP